MSNDQARALWERGWDGHDVHQRERMSNLPFSEKLRWLDEAHRIVLHLSRATLKPVDPLGRESES
jgi:hypothetical protein